MPARQLELGKILSRASMLSLELDAIAPTPTVVEVLIVQHFCPRAFGLVKREDKAPARPRSWRPAGGRKSRADDCAAA
jgi:hypothetical protein